MIGSGAVAGMEGDGSRRSDHENECRQAREPAAEAPALAESLAAFFCQVEHRCQTGIVELR
jgi:flavin reductase (DIM6/NTAB) family NADH-FMN oxidoreductase RutF